MPYIDHNSRVEIAEGRRPMTAGELNYVLTKAIIKFWVNSSRRYQDINDIVGALEGAKLEFYRRVAVPYEENKIKENADVY